MLKLHAIESPNLEPPALPSNPENCRIAIQLLVGPPDEPGSESFQFLVVTPLWLADQQEVRWGTGLLIVPRFSWEVVEHSIAKLLAGTPSKSWNEAAISLSRSMAWEFENYQPYSEDGR